MHEWWGLFFVDYAQEISKGPSFNSIPDGKEWSVCKAYIRKLTTIPCDWEDQPCDDMALNMQTTNGSWLDLCEYKYCPVCGRKL